MRTFWKKLTVSATVYFCLLSVVLASELPHSNVFQIRTGNCLAKPGVMTGFWAKDLKGIITALHGVVGCKTITAISSDADETFKSLEIQQVDIARDAALLYSPEMAHKKLPDGLSSVTTNLSYDNLYVIGYPLGITESITSRDIRIRDKAYRQLRSLLPPAESDVLRQRQSPSLDIRVISLEGHLLPGHSGAPVLNGKHQVIGIANGGLNEGGTEIVWAIPWQQIVWQDTNKELLALKKLEKTAKPTMFNTSTLQNRIQLEIMFIANNKQFSITQNIYPNRSSHYFIPIYHDDIIINNIKNFIMQKVDGTLMAEGFIGSSYPSVDGQYEVSLKAYNIGFILTVTTLTIPNKNYLVNIALPASMTGSKIFVDNKPANIIEQVSIIATIQLNGKDGPHEILVKKGDYCCRIKRLIRKNTKLTPCYNNRKLCQ